MKSVRPVVLVVGASYGIGRAVALRFGAGGYHAILCGRNRAGLEETARQIGSGPGSSSVHPVDIAQPEQVANLFAEIAPRFGPMDVLWNGASGFTEGRTEDLSWSDLRSLFDVTALGAINVVAHFLKQSTGMPLIYNVTCDWDFPMTNGIATFIAAKKALEGFSIALQKERTGDVRVCIVAPADVATHSHADGAGVDQILDETEGAAIAPTELADLCFTMNQYKSLFVHRISIRPWHQKFQITYA